VYFTTRGWRGDRIRTAGADHRSRYLRHISSSDRNAAANPDVGYGEYYIGNPKYFKWIWKSTCEKKNAQPRDDSGGRAPHQLAVESKCAARKSEIGPSRVY
jgi:hypothetical protein